MQSRAEIRLAPNKPYAVVIHSEPSGGFRGDVPALPGCSARGGTVEELLAKLSDHIRKAAAQAVKPGMAEDRDRGGDDPEGHQRLD
jgi:predicted RNase H-like HicB family nuclease